MIKTSSTTVYGVGLLFLIEKVGRPRPVDVSARVPTISGNRRRWMRFGERLGSQSRSTNASAYIARSPAGLICTIATPAILE